MKFQFDADLEYQREAITAVADLFEGQETCRTNFTVLSRESELYGREMGLGIGNRLRLLDEDILTNVRAIQIRNGLAPIEALPSLDFTVEMETGTGKTYVYLRTAFELHQRYGFTKFVIVVPSIAIKEGVFKALEMTEAHFKGLYDNVPFDYFVYDSQDLSQVRSFATSDHVQFMVINIDAFRRSFKDPAKEDKANIIHRAHDRMSGFRPIEFIQETQPIVIIDEPQSVDTTPKSREAIASLNPLCTLRYSATHREKHGQLYRLDAVDAYERQLVKQIEVAGVEVEGGHNRAYVKLVKVDNTKGGITATVEIDVVAGAGHKVSRTKRTVRSGVDLFELSGGRDVYDGYIVDDIYCEKGKEYITFTSRPEVIRLHQAIGDVNDDDLKRIQIRRTVQEHLDKSLRLRKQGLKVLSLFFLDKVANYRDYDEDGNSVPGKYAVMFEEEFLRFARQGKYRELFGDQDLEALAARIHNGYFAIDKKQDAAGRDRYKESRGEGKTLADESAYQLIMQDKERLLSFETELEFIFSHSALREGWDNPNVFQICTLNETASTIKKRQEIGRGLRLAVNQQGERVFGFDVNTLTVMANESYEDFARQLQREIEQDTGIRFGVVERHSFANIPVRRADGAFDHFGVEQSEEVFFHLADQDYVDSVGRVQDNLRAALRDGTLDLPAGISEEVALDIAAVLTKIAGHLNVRDADERTRVHLNKAVLLSPEFQELWDQIKYRTTFRVDFDPEELIEACADEIRRSLVVGTAKFVVRKSKADIDRGGVRMGEAEAKVYRHDATDFELPDIVTYLQDETHLTRRSIVAILRRSGKLGDFVRNPQKFIEGVSELIRHQMRLFIVDGIKYQRIGETAIYAQELFEDQELFGYLEKNMLEAEKCVYDHVVYDSEVEHGFAAAFERSDDVKVYAKLPSWFRIETPLGGYNPDWAVVVEEDGAHRLYFVVESKGSLLKGDLRASEEAKIECGRRHFAALGTEARFEAATSFETFEDSWG
jgi:type III restriction enzyme